MRIKNEKKWCSSATPFRYETCLLACFVIYFLSWWIANLGVVPLFFICFLRVAPILFLVFSLLVFVTRVLETILNLLLGNHEKRPLVLAKTAVPVKVLMASAAFIAFFPHSSQANSKEIDLILARGEQKELSHPQGIRRFSVGNGEVLAKKMLKHSLLIKGKSVGFSDLKIWEKTGNEVHYRVYVLSKSDQLTSLQLGEAVKSLGLELKLSGSYIHISGEVSKLEDYLLLKKISSGNQDLLVANVSISRGLKSQIIGEIYEHLFRENLDSFKCQNRFLKIECYYSEEQKFSENVQKLLKEKYQVEFLPVRKVSKNFRIKLKLIQMERMDGKELSVGLNQLSARVGDFFEQGLMSLVNQNLIMLRHHNMAASTLAEPEILSILDEETKVEIGSEIPYRADALNAINTQWKFAGLRLKIMLKSQGKDLLLKYETEFTRPQEGAISGSKNFSQVHVTKGVPLEIFQITFKTQTEEKSGIPYLENIPLLGEIFKSKSDVVTYKSITGLLLVEEIR